MLRGLRLLVVDENEDWRELMELALTETRAHVVTAGSAAGALAAFRSLRPHVLVSDLLLPRLEGQSFVPYVRQVVEPALGLAPTPAVAVTAVNEPSLAELARSFGFQALLRKPFASQELVREVARLAGLDFDKP